MLSENELALLEAAAARRNGAAGLTGLLVYGGMRFYGVLEGAEDRVHACVERIITDPRHRNLRVILEESDCKRRFRGWTLARVAPVSGDASTPAFDEMIATMLGRP
jgi:hypothetical protein